DLHRPPRPGVGLGAPTLPLLHSLGEEEGRLVRPTMHLDGELPIGDREIRVHAGRDLVLALVIPPFLRPELLEEADHLALRAGRLLPAVIGEEIARELPPVPLGRRLVAVSARIAQTLRTSIA